MTATLTPADLADPNRYVRCEAVPILDAHTRPRWDAKGNSLPPRVYDEDRLRLICANSNRRDAEGNPGVLLIGHTNLKADHPETAQPPPVGITRNYTIGDWQGRPCIMADLYVEASKAAEAFSYPRRSVEVFYDDADPAGNYIDALALIRRTPERSLGLLVGPRQKDLYALGMSPDDDAPPEPGATEPAPDAPLTPATDPEPEPTSAPEPDPTSSLEPPRMAIDPEDLKAIVAAVLEAQAAAATAAAAPTDDAPADDDTPPTDAPTAEPEKKDDDALDQMQKRHRRELDQFQRDSKAQIDAALAKVGVLEQYNLRIERKADLVKLQADGFLFDLDEELAEVMGKTPEQYSKHLEKIPKVYRQSAVDQPLIDTGSSPRPKRDDKSALTPAEFPKIARIMEQHQLSYPAALEQYQQERQAERA